MVLDAPRPCAKGSYASPTSVHHQLDIHRQLAERAGDQAEEAADLRNRVALRVPGDRRLRKAQLLHQSGLGLEPALAEGGERAGCTREFTHQHARTQLRETCAMPLDR